MPTFDAAEHDQTPPIACSLAAGDMATRVAEWQEVLAGAARAAIPGGVRVSVPAERAGRLAALAVAERACCPFLDLQLIAGVSEVHLEVRAPADAAEVVAGLFGMIG